MTRDYVGTVMKGASLVFIFSIFGSILGYILRIALFRTLSIADFGLFYAVFAFISLVAFVQDFGFSAILSKFIPEFLVKKQFWKIKSSIVFLLIEQFVIGLIAFFPLIIFSDQIATLFFKNMTASPLIFWLALTNIITFGIFLSIFQGFKKMGRFSIAQVLQNTIVVIYVWILISTGMMGVVEVSIGYFIGALVCMITFFIFLVTIKSDGFRGFLREGMVWNSKLYKILTIFALSIFIGTVAGAITNYTDTLTLTYFRSPEEVGYYQVALPTSQIPFALSVSLIAILFPIISELWTRKETLMLSNGLMLILKLLLVIAVPLAMIFIAFPDSVILLLFGGKSLPAVLSLQILSVGVIFLICANLFSSTLIAIGRPLLNTKIVLFIAVFNLTFNLLLVPIYGVMGASLTTAASFILLFLLSIYFAKKNVSFNIPFFDIVKIFSGGILLFLVINYLKAIMYYQIHVETVVIFSISFILYMAFIIFTKTITKNDLRIFKNSLPRFLYNILNKVLF